MKLPNWLSEDKSIAVHSGREHFLIRNRGVLAAVLRTFRNKPILMVTSFLHPVSWLLILFIFLLTISLFDNILFFWILALLLGTFVAVLPYDSMMAILKKTFFLLIPPLILYLPAVFWGRATFVFLLRMPLILFLVASYSELMTMTDLLAALKKLRFPDLVLLQLDITVKYIYIFGQMLVAILKAIEARAVGRYLKFQVGSNIWGMLYIKAVEYGKELQHAMEARCFTGEYYDSKRRLLLVDYAVIVICLLLSVLIILEG